MEVLQIKELPREDKILLLRELGYDADEDGHVTKDGQLYMDPFVDAEVTVDNMCILPGSAVVLNDNPISIDAYFEKYGDWE